MADVRPRTAGKGMLTSSFTFLTVRGIPIGAHWSWLFVFALVAWSLITYLFPASYPGLTPIGYVVMGVVGAVLFFTSILLHELGHAVQARREGMHIDGITLWLFGGVARFRSMFPSPGAEFRIAVAGPLVTVVLVVVFFSVSRLLPGDSPAIVGVADYLARINGILVLFNLVPALPLDGGRILRAHLWKQSGSFSAATVAAAKGGRIFAFFLIGFGVLGLFSGAVTGGIWFSFLGWFLLEASRAETSGALLREVFAGLRVRDLMTPEPESVSPEITVKHLLDEVGGHRPHSTYPVIGDGEVLGLVSLRMAAGVPSRVRGRRKVADVMLAGDDVVRLSPDVPVLEALERMSEGTGRALVIEEGSLKGILSPSDLSRAVEVARLREPGRTVSNPWIWLLIASAAIMASFYYMPPLRVLEPTPAIDITETIEIKGVPVDKINGRYLLVAVTVQRRPLFDVLIATLDPRRHVVSVNQLTGGRPENQFGQQQRAVFEESRRAAAAAAASAVGLDVTVKGAGAEVLEVGEGFPADGVLRAGDVIRAANTRQIRLAGDLSGVLSARKAGTKFTLRVLRDGKAVTVKLRSARVEAEGRTFPGIGVIVGTKDLDVRLPFEVEFEKTNIGGPSAGLAYALLIADLLDKGDFARGRSVAATGTIDLNGEVGAVGGVDLKAIGARRQGAVVFLVPEGDPQIDGIEDLRTLEVETLEGAIRLLRARG